MIQEIITYLILLVTFLFVAWRFYKLPQSLNKQKNNSNICGSCATGCAVKDLTRNPKCTPETAK